MCLYKTGRAIVYELFSYKIIDVKSLNLGSGSEPGRVVKAQ